MIWTWLLIAVLSMTAEPPAAVAAPHRLTAETLTSPALSSLPESPAPARDPIGDVALSEPEEEDGEDDHLGPVSATALRRFLDDTGGTGHARHAFSRLCRADFQAPRGPPPAGV